MGGVLYWPSVLVAVFFLGAAVLKFSQPRLFVSELRDYGLLPEALVEPVAVALIVLELGGGVMTMTASFHQWGCVLLVALLLGFTAVTTRALLSGERQLSCACFGSASRTLSWSAPVRNLLLIVAVGAGIFAQPIALTTASASATLLGACLVFVWVEAAEMLTTGPEDVNV